MLTYRRTKTSPSKSVSTDPPITPLIGAGATRWVWGWDTQLASSLRILATHCCTATAVGVTCLVTGIVSSAVAGAYLAGTFATCGFVGLELCRVRGNT